MLRIHSGSVLESLHFSCHMSSIFPVLCRKPQFWVAFYWVKVVSWPTSLSHHPIKPSLFHIEHPLTKLPYSIVWNGLLYVSWIGIRTASTIGPCKMVPCLDSTSALPFPFHPVCPSIQVESIIIFKFFQWGFVLSTKQNFVIDFPKALSAVWLPEQIHIVVPSCLLHLVPPLWFAKISAWRHFCPYS